MKSLMLVSGILGLSVFAHAQKPHFPDQKWKERETDHFYIRAFGTGYDPASRYAEKVWDECVEVMPGLVADFEKNEFRTPDGNAAADAAPFRFSVYLTEDAADFNRLVDIDAARANWEEGRDVLTKKVGSYADSAHRYTVFCKGNMEQSAGGKRDITPVFIHATGATLMQGRGRIKENKLWLRGGFGYYVEHMLTKRCRVAYVDFESHYKDKDADLTRAETLGPDKDWTGPIRRQCKKGDRSTLEEVTSATVQSLTPKECGYMFALVYFLVWDDDSKKNFQKLMAESRDGAEITQDLLLETYGYDDAEAFEKKWYEWIEGRDFR